MIGSACPFRQIRLHRRSTSSGAPLVNWIKPCPAPALCSVDIILRMESNGASSTRGRSAASSCFGMPFWLASLTSAHSVASPTAFPFSSSASEHRAIAVISSVGSSVTFLTTVILFWVSVPVLSEQMICVQPSVSTAVSFRMMAWFLLILVTPMESSTVTTALRPSGTAATARDTAIMKVSITALPPLRTRFTTNTNAQITRIITLSFRLSSFSLICRGVSSSAALLSASAMAPISVSIPVPVTTACPRP